MTYRLGPCQEPGCSMNHGVSSAPRPAQSIATPSRLGVDTVEEAGAALAEASSVRASGPLGWTSPQPIDPGTGTRDLEETPGAGPKQLSFPLTDH
jgi:hypothetical protein